MILDIVAGVVILGFAWLGWQTGSVRELVRLVPVLFAGMLARAICQPIAGFGLRMTTDTAYETAIGVSFLLLFLAGWAALSVAMARLAADLGEADDRGMGDRFGGAAVGGLKGFLMAFIVTVGLLSISAGSGRPAIPYSDSRLGRVAIQKDFLGGPTMGLMDQEDSRDRRKLRGFERSRFDEDEYE